MKCHKLAQRVLPLAGSIALASGCASTNGLYAKYEDVCELPTPEVVDRVKIVKEVVEKDRVVEKIVEKVKFVDKIKVVEKIKPVETVKYVDKIKYVDRVKRIMVPDTKIKVVEKIKVVNKTEYIKQAVHGEIWEPAVYFGFDLASLNSAEESRLDRDLLVLKKNPALKLSVQAFTDSKGSQQYNRKLALKRQKTVVDYFMSKGLGRERILVSPLGEELPILGNTTTERVINRRVELMLLDTSGRPLSLTIRPNATGFKAPFPLR